MSKLNGGLFSKSRGKVAGVVTQQYAGLQVAKEYQPVVANPNTDRQQIVRAKFKLASQLTSLLGGFMNAIQVANGIQHAHFQRGKTLSEIYANTSGNMTEGVAVASINLMPNFRRASLTEANLVSGVTTYASGTITFTANTSASVVGGSARLLVRTVVIYPDGRTFSRTDNASASAAEGFVLTISAPNLPTGATIVQVGVMTQSYAGISGVSYSAIMAVSEGLEDALNVYSTLGLNETIAFSNSVESLLTIA